MPTNYPGDKTATQAPSAKPEPEGTITAQIPIDGEALNVASVAQSHKAAADFVDFLLKPQAKAAAWTQPIMRYRSAPGHLRWGIGHLGLPEGQWYENFEAWGSGEDVQVSAQQLSPFLAGTIFGGWTVQVIKGAAGGTSARARSRNPDAVWGASRYLEISVGDTASDYTWVYRTPQTRFYADNVFQLEWSMKINDTTAVSLIHAGLNMPGPGTNGAVAEFRAAAGVWNCLVGNHLGVSAYGAGGALDTSWHRFKIAWLGENADDSGVKRVLFFIDGALIKNVNLTDEPAAFMPDLATDPSARPSLFVERASPGTGKVLNVSPMRLVGNTWLNAF